MAATLLIIDDDETQLALTQAALRQNGAYHTIGALGGRAAIERYMLRQNPRPHAIVLDLLMPDVPGIEVVRAIRRCDAYIPIIVLAPPHQRQLAAQAILAGACDMLAKPVSVELLKLTIEKHLQREAMREELARLRRHARADYLPEDVIGAAPSMQFALRQIRAAVTRRQPSVFCGEPGSGKTLIARVMHTLRGTGGNCFITLTPSGCDAFMEMLQSQAMLPPQQVLEHFHTNAGTIFVPHIEQWPTAQQQALIPFLKGMEQTARHPWQAVRFMFSCNEPLTRLAGQGRMPAELAQYLQTQTITLPPLRERRADIQAIAEYHLKRFSAAHAAVIQGMDSDAAAMLMQYDWPGNVTELVNLMQRAALLCEGPLLRASMIASLMPTGSAFAEGTMALAHPLQAEGQYCLLTCGGDIKPFEQVEAEIIRFAIEHYGGKMTEVARRLGIGRSTLYRKMQDYNLRVA